MSLQVAYQSQQPEPVFWCSSLHLIDQLQCTGQGHWAQDSMTEQRYLHAVLGLQTFTSAQQPVDNQQPTRRPCWLG